MIARIVKSDEELQDAYDVRTKVFVEEQQVPEEEEIDQFEREASHVVLYDGDKPVGAGRFRILNGIGKIERICVLPDYRSKGAGKIIMEKLEEIAASKEMQTLKLNAQTHAEPFYEKLGYNTISKETFLDAGIPHVTMVKEIKF
ncbi:GNAT family N-acetyltransferase [Metabacillus idriensis]|uniref:GNAT family N-acetyltransferase n=1 Tax=Metabacillus idriensis TaxID=324768 RepID=A0A6I2M3Y1_9BACI|nr:GNAT family N-acetyltransferase [Metabacillus idriensis]MCM3595174.1 GNAT family N-acetyltransferase [Metabacillus idriensis]MRX52798.1 GNAT family N-acetyltransferase [Metabacillus idriensis]OHR74340.1 GNAT family N-acetyltransferase [Bacillus sp. HMSC76G11]